eukprot:scpid54671/ scgid12087/ 
MIRLLADISKLSFRLRPWGWRSVTSSGSPSDPAWRPVSVLDHPRNLVSAQAADGAEKEKERHTAIPWRSGKYASQQRRHPIADQLASGTRSHNVDLLGSGNETCSSPAAFLSENTAGPSDMVSLMGDSDEINMKNFSSVVSLAKKSPDLIDPASLASFMQSHVGEKDPNGLLQLWKQLWSRVNARPASLTELSRFATRVDFSDLTAESVCFLALSLASCQPQDNADFFKMARAHFTDFFQEYTPNEAASLSWALMRAEVVDDLVVDKLAAVLDKRTSELSWTGVCQAALVYRTHNYWFAKMHTDIYERYVNEVETMNATELMCFAVAYRFGIDNKQSKNNDILDSALHKASLLIPKAGTQELLDTLSLFSRDLLNLRRSHIPHILVTCLRDRLQEITVEDARSIFHVLRVIKCLDARFFVSPWLKRSGDALKDLDTPTLLHFCTAGLLHHASSAVPIGDLLTRDPSNLRVLIKSDDGAAADLWALHLHAIARGWPCLPPQVARLCQLRALKTAQHESKSTEAQLNFSTMVKAMVASFNSVKKLGRSAVKQDVATNLVLPSGHCVAAAMLLAGDRTVRSWDDYPRALPWISQNRIQVEDSLSWKELDENVRSYVENLRDSCLSPCGIILVDYVTDVENKLKARLLSSLGWSVAVLSHQEWKAAVKDGDAELLLASKVFMPIKRVHENSGNPMAGAKSVLDAYRVSQSGKQRSRHQRDQQYGRKDTRHRP